jgi:hypothetical protein
MQPHPTPNTPAPSTTSTKPARSIARTALRLFIVASVTLFVALNLTLMLGLTMTGDSLSTVPTWVDGLWVSMSYEEAFRHGIVSTLPAIIVTLILLAVASVAIVITMTVSLVVIVLACLAAAAALLLAAALLAWPLILPALAFYWLRRRPMQTA